MNSRNSILGASTCVFATFFSMSAFADTHAYKYLPGVSVNIGQGFSVDAAGAPPAPCLKKVKAMDDPDHNINQGESFTEQVVLSNSTLKSVLGIDTELDASILAYSGKGSFSFNSSYQLNESAINIVYQGHADYTRNTLDLSEAEYRPDIQKLVDQRNFTEFKRQCGDELVTSVTRGTSISLVISIRGLDQSTKESISSSIEASGGFGPLSGSAKFTLNQALTTSNSSVSTSISLFVQGGDGLSDLETLATDIQTPGKSLDQLERGVRQVFHKLNGANAAITGFVTQPYPYVSQDNEDLISNAKEDQLSMLAEAYRYQEGRKRLLERLFLSEDQSGIPSKSLQQVSREVQNLARQDMPVLTTYVLRLARAHESCLRDATPELASCVIPKKPEMPGIDLIYVYLTL